MKTKKHYYILITLLIIGGISFIISCDKEKDTQLPQTNRLTIETDSIKSVLYHTAIAYGSIGEFKNITIQQYGHCWDTIEIPTIESNKTLYSNLASQSTFNSNLADLKPAKKYFVRSYAKMNTLVAYGKISSFTTKPLEPPTLTSDSIRDITSTTAKIWGAIKLDGGTIITARGVCWGTSMKPTLANQHAESNNQTSTFSTSVTGLILGTNYYVRVYATNSYGTAYGEDILFTTINLPTVNTKSITSISTNTAISGGDIVFDGGSAIIAKGICWSNLINPTTSNSITNDGVGTSSFVSSLSGLTPNTTYYVKAYATNSQGTSYGSQISFTTIQSLSAPSVNTINPYDITSSSVTVGGNITSDGGSIVTERGIYWGTITNPVNNGTKLQIGSSTELYSTTLNSLVFATTYYVIAYAVNSTGESIGSEVSFATSGETGTVTDIDANIYNTITIGTQVWMADNLKTTHYRDGSSITNITDNDTWINLTSEAYCWYNNDITNKSNFGALYNYYAVADSRKLCPTGWHTPTDAEWRTLTDYLTNNGYGYQGSGNDIAKSMASTFGWTTNSTEGSVGYDQASNNSSGFTGIPCGYRSLNVGYINSGISTCWWSSEYNAAYSWEYCLVNLYANVLRNTYEKKMGLSVRCIKD